MKTEVPSEILEGPDARKVDYFNKIRIPHPNLDKVFDRLNLFQHTRADNHMLFLVGPSGVGKSTVSKFFCASLKKTLSNELKQDPSRLPYLYMEVSSDGPDFSWKAFYRRLLKSANEILVDKKIPPSDMYLRPVFRQKSDTQSAGGLRLALENTLKQRRPAAIVFDEAHHLMKIGNRCALETQIDTLKSLANLTKIPIVLIGTYQLLDLSDSNAQIIRRSSVIHFERYRNTIAAQRKVFEAIADSFMLRLPFENQEPLDCYDYFYSRSLGCVGLLKEMFDAAIKLAIKEKSDVLRESHFKRIALPAGRCQAMLDDIKKGEKKISAEADAENDLYEKLGLPPLIPQTIPKPINVKPGRRKPKGDMTGGLYDIHKVDP